MFVYRTRVGAKFTNTSVQRLLIDPVSKGIHRQNYTRSGGRNRSWDIKPKEEWVETPVEGIVPVETWEAVNGLLTERRLDWKKKPARLSPHLFAGYAFCACGEKMYVWSNSPKYTCKKCKNKIPSADLEAVYRKRQFIEAITEKVEVGRDEVTIHLLYRPQQHEGNATMTMRGRMNTESAQTLALKALSFVVASDGALERLMELSGLDSLTLRERAAEPEVLASLLDFLLMDEGLLVDFCHGESIDPKDVHMARHLLGGP